MVDAITAPAIDKEVGMMEGDEKDTTPGSAPLGPMSDEKEKVKEEEKKMGSGTAYFRIFKFSDNLDCTLLLVGTIAACGSGVALALVNIIFGGFVGIVNDFGTGASTPQQFMDEVGDFALFFIYLFVGRFVLGYIFTITFSISGTRLTRTIRYRFLEGVLSQDIAFFDREGSGNVSSQVTTNGNMIQQGISEKLGLAVQAVATFITAFIIAFEAQPKLAGITVTIVPVIVLVTGWAVDSLTKVEQEVLEIHSQGASLAEDAIGSIRSVQAFWARPKLVKKYDEYLQKAHTAGMKQSWMYGTLFSIEYFCIYAGFALAFYQGVRMYASGEIDNPGTVVTVLFSVIIAAASLTQIAPHLQAFSNAASAASALFGIIDRKSSLNPFDESGEKPGDEPVEEIELTNVKFAYPSRPHITVLDDFTLKIPAKKTTALVGASGSGKSTIIGLLERWYDPLEGQISLNGRPITGLNLNWLRQKIRLVQQEPVLFMGSVFDNVSYGLAGTEYENASKDEQMRLVVEACKTANAHDFVSELPQGYDTLVGERAGLLSGGQKQRIAIARSIISNPEVLLLDEATSALDPHSEGVVQQALEKASMNRTTIVIAHKLSTIKKADNIVVMFMGKIVEQGTHDDLIAANGAYARLVRAQDLNKRGISEDEDIDEEIQAALTRSKTQVPTGEAAKEHVESLNFDNAKLLSIFKLCFTILWERSNLTAVYGLSIICCIIGALTYPAQALLFAELMDVFTLTGFKLTERGDFFALMFFIVALANLFTYFAIGWMANILGQDVSHYYRRELFNAILRQDIVFFDRPENTSGGLTSNLSSKPQQLVELLSFNIAMILICFINIFSSSLLGIIIGWKLGLVVTFTGIPFVFGAGYLRMRFDQKLLNETGKTFTDSAAVAGEAVAAIRTVTSLTIEKTVLKKFAGKVDGVVKKSIPSLIHTTFWFSVSQSTEYLILALGFWYGCKLVSTGEYTMTSFFTSFLGIFFALQAASQLFMYSTSIGKGVAAGNYILWLNRLQPVVSETPENSDKKPSDDDPEYNLDSLSFAYPSRPDARVIKSINLVIKPGNFVALVGASGCGKSTMIALFLRFYDPISGTINLNGVPADTFNPRLYRRDIALVSQEPTLYQGDLRMNIALGIDSDDEDIKVTDEQIMEAARQANIHDFINSLPDGLSTYVGNRGSQLSGGQRQRIAIARALIRNPRILLLDEATSALDTESEKIVQEALNAAAKGGKRITVAVAHRLSTVRDADVICVFGGGRIVEMGTHTQLVSKKGLYWEMCQAQSLDQATE